MYKTISFPRSESGTEIIERLRVVVDDKKDPEFSKWLNQLSSKELRIILADDYKSFVNQAIKEKYPLSFLALDLLRKYFKKLELESSELQLNLFKNSTSNNRNGLGKHGTFTPNLIESIHRWYPYIEGFSSTFVETLINKWSSNARTIYDPFAGTGTTLTVAAMNGIHGYFSEVNPFMQLVIRCKTNLLKKIIYNNQKSNLINYFDQVIRYAENNRVSEDYALSELNSAFPDRPFFLHNRLIDIVSLKKSISEVSAEDKDFVDFARLALGSIGVASSEMKRASDLRYRRDNELLDGNYNVFNEYSKKIDQIVNDISDNLEGIADVDFVSNNSLYENNITDQIDLIITSPPYLNGTNYFRNTKIELWLSGYINHERELVNFNREAMIAGINNVSKQSRESKTFEYVEDIAKKLDKVAYDKRIPALVRGYSSDTYLWLSNCKRMLKPDGKMVIDIGDSKFAGVHVPTDKFLISIAKDINLELIDTEIVRKRSSNDGTVLKQVLLTFKKPERQDSKTFSIYSGSCDNYLEQAKTFSKLPYKVAPYDSRNWGHNLHSLCSYQGKLKPAIAYFLVNLFTKEGDTILDPMSGSGTIPLEAFLNKRKAIASDIQQLGFILSSAKVNKPNSDLLNIEMNSLLNYIDENKHRVVVNKYETFGLNGKIPEYFHPETLSEVLAAREYLLSNICNSVERAVVYSSLLHILHGNRPYALSRRSHPVTPFKPTGEFEYRDINSRLTDKVNRVMKSYDSNKYLSGESHLMPFEELKLTTKVDAIITSPPFAASTRFYSSNWMRLWMSGWEPEEFKQKKTNFLEEKQKVSLDIYYEFFNKCYEWLKPGGKLIMHLGKTSKVDMSKELVLRSAKYFDLVYKFDEDVSGREKFGIRDQGATSAHQYIFLLRK